MKKPENHIPDTTKTVQLTLEQLRGMNGEPVWVEFEDGSGGLWGIVHITIFEQIVFPNGLHCTLGHPYYGKAYKVYPHPTSRIDRGTREPEKKKTKADRIRAMSDEQMTQDLINMIMELCEDGVPCKEFALAWFKRPAEED